MEKGTLSIHSENIMPIIKKWLYTDSDIFIREMVSNATDAVKKLKKLRNLGEAAESDADYRIDVIIDKENKTLSFADNGLGMTAEEVKKYINQIAFSGANEFADKYKDKMEAGNDIIGHFGLGFYSAFMVADKVQIDTLSYREGERAVRWLSDGTTEYEIDDGERDSVGTTVTLFINEESVEFLETYKVRGVLRKYCGFMPVEIFLQDLSEKNDDTDEADEEADETAETKESPVNDTAPLWTKKPVDCTEEEYKSFYHKTFTDFNDPLFWIHLNLDYPFRLQGILYFPKLKHELESIEGQVKLFNNQVFIADNIKEVIPEFLLLLKGAIDCPDLPLNVSRSFLQNDGYVQKMSAYITKKVADKLTEIFREDREAYNKYWDDINPFVKYGCIREESFYEKVKDELLFKTIGGEYLTTSEYLEKNQGKSEKKIYYVTNEQQQAQYIKLFKDQGIEAVLLTQRIDNPFISYLENYNREVSFQRIDSELSDALRNGDENAEEQKAYEELFRKELNNEKLTVKAEALKSDSVSAVILLSEQSRRMEEMSRQFGGMPGMEFPTEETLMINTGNPLIKKLMEIKDDPDRAGDISLICKQIYDLAMISHKPLKVDEMVKFIERSNEVMARIL